MQLLALFAAVYAPANRELSSSTKILASFGIVLLSTFRVLIDELLTIRFPHPKIPWSLMDPTCLHLRSFFMLLLVISYNEMADDTSSLLYVNLALLVVSFTILFKRLQSGFMFTRRLNMLTVFMEANLAMTCVITIISQLFELESALLFGIEVCLLYLCGGFGFYYLADLLERREILKSATAAEKNSKNAI